MIRMTSALMSDTMRASERENWLRVWTVVLGERLGEAGKSNRSEVLGQDSDLPAVGINNVHLRR